MALPMRCLVVGPQRPQRLFPLRPAPASLLQYPRQDQQAAGATLRREGCRSRTVVFAQRQTDTGKDTELFKKLPDSPSSISSPQEGEYVSEDKWGLFDGKAYLQRWEVPWGGKELAIGMIGWAASFLGVGLAFIPVAQLLSGPEGFAALPQVDKAYFALANQLVVTIVGVAVVRAAVSGYKPLPSEFFRTDLSSPFKKPYGWLTWSLIGVCLSPLVVYFTSVAVDSLGYDGVSGRGTVDSVTSIISLDGPTFAALFGTTAILAPILEETIFRGFLLTSLTKWMPVPVAVVLSSLAFGMVHFTPKDFPQLTALGILLGLSYVRSRNLLTPMLIHGAWNGSVLSILFMLTAMGIDVDELIHSGGM